MLRLRVDVNMSTMLRNSDLAHSPDCYSLTFRLFDSRTLAREQSVKGLGCFDSVLMLLCQSTAQF